MRTFRLLATSLLVALSMGVSSCSEELDSQPMESYPEGGEPLDVVCKEYGISDYEDIELLSYYKNNLEQANFSGLREEKLWLASFNVKDKSPIINWTDELPFNRNRKIYKGYGEYEDVTIQQITMLQTMYFNPKEFVASLSYYFGKDYGYLALLFRHDTQTKEVQVKRSEILAGFQYSIINNDCCYSLSGDTLYIAEKGFGYSNVGTLYTSEFISHEEAIYTHRDNKGFFVGRRNFKLGEDLWHIQGKSWNIHRIITYRSSRLSSVSQALHVAKGSAQHQIPLPLISHGDILMLCGTIPVSLLRCPRIYPYLH